MHSFKIRSAALAALLGPGLACGLEEVGGDTDEAMIPPAVQQAFDESCATSAGCHATGSSLVVLSAPESSAILTASSGSGGAPFVSLGDVENSYIAQKILNGSAIVGGQMPPSPQSDNDDVNTAIIVGWIAGVAIEDEGGGDGDGDATGDGDGDGDVVCYAEAPIPAAPSFAADVWPIFEARCATCHAVNAPAMPDAVTAYGNLISMPASAAMANYVEPGDPDGSYLWHKLAGTFSSIPGGGGSPMPQGSSLCAAEFQVVYAWILADAPE